MPKDSGSLSVKQGEESPPTPRLASCLLSWALLLPHGYKGD